MRARNLQRLMVACGTKRAVEVQAPRGAGAYVVQHVDLGVAPERAPASLDDVVTSVKAVVDRVEENVSAVRLAVEQVANGQQDVTKGLDRVTRTLEQPVKPILNAQGKVVGAKREPLGD